MNQKKREFQLVVEEVGLEKKIVATLRENRKTYHPVYSPNSELVTLASQMGNTLKEALDKIVPYVEEACEDRNAPTLPEVHKLGRGETGTLTPKK